MHIYVLVMAFMALISILKSVSLVQNIFVFLQKKKHHIEERERESERESSALYHRDRGTIFLATNLTQKMPENTDSM